MRRSLSLLAAILFLVSATTAHAASESVSEGMVKKFKRGIINTFTGIIEFPIQIMKGYNEGFMGDEKNKLLGTTWGIFEGFGHAAGRTLSGIADVVSFWAVNPKDNKEIGIPLDAEYAWDKGEPRDLFDPNFTEAAITPVVNKFFRGAGNTLFGFVELSKQIKKGRAKRYLDLGIFKGLWYWASREVSGISDLATAIFPNPEDTMGAAFDEEWSWDGFSD